MRCVESIDEIKSNMSVLDDYLSEKSEPEYAYAIDRIKKGICFIAYFVDGAYRFYPSRFIGYANNNMNKHENNEQKDGTETTPVISAILNQQCTPDIELEKKYKKYCEQFGFMPLQRGSWGVEHKYWRMK